MEFYKQRIRRNHHHFLQLLLIRILKTKIILFWGRLTTEKHGTKAKQDKKNKHTLIHYATHLHDFTQTLTHM